MYEYVGVESLLVQQCLVEHSSNSTALRNHPCTSSKPSTYVTIRPIRVHIKISYGMYVNACGVQVVFVEHGALGICKSPVPIFWQPVKDTVAVAKTSDS